VHPGDPFPLGTALDEYGCNFSVYSRHADEVELVLYDAVDASEPTDVIVLEHRTRAYWHIYVPGVKVGQLYAYRARGVFAPTKGLFFDGDKVLLDPYGRAVAVPESYDRAAAVRSGRNDAVAMKSVVAARGVYDWGGDTPLRRPFAQTVIYELHVGGFTKHPSSGVPEHHRGTYAGVIDKIPYLKNLGVTAVELLPVFQFDWQRAPEGLTNYWGYAPVSFFAPHSGYCTQPHKPLCALNEFREMVKALHEADIEVFVDVVFGQTAEGGADGATISWRGLGCRSYYMLENGGGDFANYSGTGNTLNANKAVVRRMIVDSLHYWVEHMHVDGFRFDLASILSRDENGVPQPQPPILFDIASDPVLAGTKLIAEAWDAAGLYQVGSFAGEFWKEWNGRFRDDVRSFVRGDKGTVPQLADRLLGSPDLYGKHPRAPEQSINFITAHDGFTVNDLVTYEHKHNQDNGEDNRDGHNDNRSCNHGVEGPTDDPSIEKLRNRQVKNLLAINLLSLGAPMILMGDEMRRTQKGNNNAYCQDNEISWMNWDDLDKHADIHRFVRHLIKLRWLRESVHLAPHLTLEQLRTMANVRLHGLRVGEPDMRYESLTLALSATSLSRDVHLYYAANGWNEPLSFELPEPTGTAGWRRVMDTYLDSPEDIMQPDDAPAVETLTYLVQPRSIIALLAPPTGGATTGGF
jgi:glycogen operon protein